MHPRNVYLEGGFEGAVQVEPRLAVREGDALPELGLPGQEIEPGGSVQNSTTLVLGYLRQTLATPISWVVVRKERQRTSNSSVSRSSCREIISIIYYLLSSNYILISAGSLS